MILLCNPSFYDGGVTIGEPKGGLNIPAERKKNKKQHTLFFFPKFFLILFAILDFWKMQKMNNQICCGKGEK
jgi:hypothetical protein